MRAELIAKIAAFCIHVKCCQPMIQGKLNMQKVAYVQKGDITYLWLVSLTLHYLHILFML